MIFANRCVSLALAVGLCLLPGRSAPAATTEWFYSAAFETVLAINPQALPPGATERLLSGLGSLGIELGEVATGSFTIDDSIASSEPGFLVLENAVESQIDVGDIHATSFAGGSNVFVASSSEPGSSDLIYFWSDVASLPFDPGLFPQTLGASLLGQDLSAWTTLPFPAGPPALSILEPYRTPVSVDDLVTSLILGVSFDVDPGEGVDRRAFQLIFRLTSLVPEPSVTALLAAACAVGIALRRRATS